RHRQGQLPQASTASEPARRPVIRGGRRDMDAPEPSPNSAPWLRRGMPIVTSTARRVASPAHHGGEESELVSLGMDALARLARAHDPRRADLDRYLGTMLRWTMMSEVRRSARRWRLMRKHVSAGNGLLGIEPLLVVT